MLVISVFSYYSIFTILKSLNIMRCSVCLFAYLFICLFLFTQTHHTIMTQLLQSSVRLLDCPWLQQQQRSLVETCIKTLAMTGESERERETERQTDRQTSSSFQLWHHLLLLLLSFCSQESLHLSSSGPGVSHQLHVVEFCAQLSVPLQPKLQVLVSHHKDHFSQQPLGL